MPIVTVPDRARQLGFSPMAMVTVSEPLPRPASTTEIQLAFGVTSQLVSASPVTSIGMTCV